MTARDKVMDIIGVGLDHFDRHGFGYDGEWRQNHIGDYIDGSAWNTTDVGEVEIPVDIQLKSDDVIHCDLTVSMSIYLTGESARLFATERGQQAFQNAVQDVTFAGGITPTLDDDEIHIDSHTATFYVEMTKDSERIIDAVDPFIRFSEALEVEMEAALDDLYEDEYEDDDDYDELGTLDDFVQAAHNVVAELKSAIDGREADVFQATSALLNALHDVHCTQDALNVHRLANDGRYQDALDIVQGILKELD